eukprot:tig00020675_g12582.t1
MEGRVSVICPVTDEEIERHSLQRRFAVRETPAAYEAVTSKHVAEIPAKRTDFSRLNPRLPLRDRNRAGRFYHLHVHVQALSSPVLGQATSVGHAIALEDVIQALEADGDYFRKATLTCAGPLRPPTAISPATLTCVLGERDALFQKLVAAGHARAPPPAPAPAAPALAAPAAPAAAPTPAPAPRPAAPAPTPAAE